jgi:hypothetical protein
MFVSVFVSRNVMLLNDNQSGNTAIQGLIRCGLTENVSRFFKCVQLNLVESIKTENLKFIEK